MTTDELIIENATAAVGVLKKILAGKGAVQGNFYFAGVSNGKLAGLVVTLTRRDKRGATALNGGKALRKVIKGAKFGRGVIAYKNAKLEFVLHSGSASATLIQSSFKKAFNADDFKAFKALLKKARVVDPGGEEVDDGKGTEPDVTLSASEQEELDLLLKEVEADGPDDNALLEGFLSAESGQEELSEQIDALDSRLQLLKKADPVDESALAAARAELASLSYVGTDFDDDIDELDPTTLELLSASEAKRKGVLPPTPLLPAAIQIYRISIEQTDDQLNSLSSTLRSSDDPDLQSIGEYGLFGIWKSTRVPLESALLSWRATDTDSSSIVELAQGFLDHLESSERVDQIDNNPFGVAVSLQATLGPALRGLIQSAQART